MAKISNDLTMKKFGKLTVLEKAESKGKSSYWLCECECGNKRLLRRDKLIYGKATSCKNCSQSYKNKHGMTGTRIYKIWSKMKERCYYKNDKKHYPNYGGRGIEVCDEWKNDFMNFYNWAMENGYNDTLSIDRIDVNGNYEPNNCRWATIEEQNYNKRNTTYININNKKYTIKDLSDITGLEKVTIRYMYDREGEDKFTKLIKPYIQSI